MNCSHCNELLNEDEIKYFNVTVQEMPLCAKCILIDWGLM